MDKKLPAKLIIFLSLYSCGVGPGPKFRDVQEVRTIETSSSSIYAADLIPINVNLHLMKVGVMAFEKSDDQITFGVHLRYGPAGVTHKQGIYSGTRCPNIFDDVNKDAYIDFLEAQSAIGGLLIPLDGEIESQREGFGRFPISESDGKYTYQMTGSFEKMMGDLKDIDENLEDNIIKLSTDENLSLEGKVLLIQGASEETILPPTVPEAEGTTTHKSLPFACAIIKKADKIPPELADFSGINQLSIPVENPEVTLPTPIELDTETPPDPESLPWYRRMWDNIRNEASSTRISTFLNDHQNL